MAGGRHQRESFWKTKRNKTTVLVRYFRNLHKDVH